MPIIAPSLLSADFLNLGENIEMLNKSKAEWMHVDVMDGVFVPNISFGIPILKAIRPATEKILDVHLMIVEPEKYFEPFAKAGADIISFHIEATNHAHRNIQMIKSFGKKAGVVLNPHTPVVMIKEIISYVDMVLIMSVNPGFGGQEFIKNTFGKIRELIELRKIFNSKFLIQVDGGVNLANAYQLVEDGADVLVAGNYIFKSQNPIQTIEELHNIKPI